MKTFTAPASHENTSTLLSFKWSLLGFHPRPTFILQEVSDLQEQLADLMRHLETQQAIASAPDETRQVRKRYFFFYRQTSRYGNLIAWQALLKFCLHNTET